MNHHNTPMIPFQSQKISGFQGHVHVPGDKSISHRSLLLASQLRGATRIYGLLEGEDVLNTAAALRLLGVDVQKNHADYWYVNGVGIGGLRESPDVIDMGNSGTSTRLLMGLVTPYPFTTFFTGDASLRKRPMKRVITPLQLMGANVTARDQGMLPLALTGTQNPKPITYRLPVASAQVKSAILLAGLHTPGVTSVIESHPTRDHTENMLEYFGIKIEKQLLEDGSSQITIEGSQSPNAADHSVYVPADPSSAAFPVVAALIAPNASIQVDNVCMNPLRAGLFSTLKEMGANIEISNERVVAGEIVADISARSSQLRGITVSADRAPSMIDEYIILAVAAACAEGETAMHGLAELRVKESDRLASTVEGLIRCGVNARAEGDSLYVVGGPVKGGATITTHLDHRIAMSFLVLGMVSEAPIVIDDAHAINTSFPGFIDLMNGAGAYMSPLHPTPASDPVLIAIDGPAASGKGTLARRLAEHFNLDYLDTGSLYRAVGLKLVYSDKDPHNKEDAIHAAMTIDAEDLVNPRLRQERIGQAASIVSAIPEVRAALLDFQRNYAKSKRGAVLDGRDIGTVVCPDAQFKFFITATLYARAKRRHKELEGEGIEVIFDSVLEDLRERDERDSKRDVAPLKPAEDAIIIDSSTMDASEVFEKACDEVMRRFPILYTAKD